MFLLSVLHEDMHGEAFTYMRQTLEYPAPQFRIAPADPIAEKVGVGPLLGDVEIPGDTFQLGAAPDLPSQEDAVEGRVGYHGL